MMDTPHIARIVGCPVLPSSECTPANSEEGHKTKLVNYLSLKTTWRKVEFLTLQNSDYCWSVVIVRKRNQFCQFMKTE